MSSPTDAPSREEVEALIARLRFISNEVSSALLNEAIERSNLLARLSEVERERDGYLEQLLEHTPSEQERNMQAIMGRNNELLARLSEVEKALEHIANHPHCSYEDGPYVSPHDSGYKMGIAEGHRCAAVSARAALQHKEPQWDS